MRALALTAALLGGWLAQPAYAATDAPQWLDRMAQAEQQKSFQGTFVYERSGSFSTHDIWHLADNGKVTERLLQLDGSAQEIVRVGGLAQCVSGTLVAGVGEGAQGSRQVLDPLKLMSWYDLAVGGQSRVAGRDAVVVTFRPKDAYRYGFEMHLDKQTGLPLKSLLVSDKGQLLERFQFTRFAPTVPDDAALKASANCKAIPVAAPVQPVVVHWHSEWMPPGFVLTGARITTDGKGAGPKGKSLFSSQTYSDGLAGLTVFFEPLSDTPAADIRTQLGPTSAVSRHLVTPKGDVLITVVGEIPMGTAERIALSMRPDDAQATQ